MIAHITQTGNISIPKIWREELGIEPNSNVIIEKKGEKIIIESLKKRLEDPMKAVDDEIQKKNIKFTREEAIKDDIYD